MKALHPGHLLGQTLPFFDDPLQAYEGEVGKAAKLKMLADWGCALCFDVGKVFADSSFERSRCLADVSLATFEAGYTVDNVGILARDAMIDGVQIIRKMILDLGSEGSEVANGARRLARKVASRPSRSCLACKLKDAFSSREDGSSSVALPTPYWRNFGLGEREVSWREAPGSPT